MAARAVNARPGRSFNGSQPEVQIGIDRILDQDRHINAVQDISDPWTVNGLAVDRAPIQRISTGLQASSTWREPRPLRSSPGSR